MDAFHCKSIIICKTVVRTDQITHMSLTLNEITQSSEFNATGFVFSYCIIECILVHANIVSFPAVIFRSDLLPIFFKGKYVTGETSRLVSYWHYTIDDTLSCARIFPNILGMKYIS